MKYLIILYCFSLSSLKAQEKNIYLDALKIHIQKDSLNETLFVEYDNYVTEHMPSNIGGKRIKYLRKEQIKGYTRNEKALYLIRVTPVYNNGESLYISVIDFQVTRKGKKYFYGNGGGSKFKLMLKPNSNEITLTPE